MTFLENFKIQYYFKILKETFMFYSYNIGIVFLQKWCYKSLNSLAVYEILGKKIYFQISQCMQYVFFNLYDSRPSSHIYVALLTNKHL